MKIKITLQRSGASAVDLMATVDTGATVGDLAERLWRADPAPHHAGHIQGRPTLVIKGATDAALDPTSKLTDSGLRSGMTVGLTWAPEGYSATGGETVAIATVVDPSGVPRDVPLRTRAGVIGRDRDNAVVLTDTLASRRHIRFAIGALPEIVDLASANGVEVNGSRITRATLRPDDVVQLGDTRLSIRVTSTGPADGAADGFTRPPRLDPRYAGQEYDAPEPPKRPETPRFPIIALLVPLLMGAVLYLITRSTLSLIFMAFSPLMVVGFAVETAMAGRSGFRKAVARYRADLADLSTEAAAAAQTEIEWRRREHPATDVCVEAVRRRGPLLWTRRPADPGFCEFRIGLGPQPSRSVIKLPTGRDLPRDLMAEAVAIAREHATVEGVPVIASPAEHGAIGVAGARDLALGVARALIAQAACLHSPAELIIAAFTDDESARTWDWLKWLPHTTSPHSPLPPRHLTSTNEGAVALVSALEEQVALRAAEQEPTTAPAILVLVEDRTPVDRSRLVELGERGWRHGVHVLWIAGDSSQLPAACRTFVEVPASTTKATVGYVHSGDAVTPLAVELLDAQGAAAVGRLMSPLVDVGARVDDDSDLPRTVSLLAVADEPVTATAEHVLENWVQNRSILTGPYAAAGPSRKAGTLRAVIGRTALGPHTLDLREDGPHALVGGTTGSGKSELLQAWILAMAAAHSPQRLTFMLIDYKGGSAFKDLALLPHTVGNFTDLDPHLVRRALTSLRAELRGRERQFALHKVKDLIELEKTGVADVPPSLVIVVDEFAALVKELPEFVDGVVDVAQRGRSLGVHLILATQRPAGVITDNLRANTNLRLALRTADEGDSVDVLGSPQAAFFDSAIPGRAVSKTGPGRLVPFQTGYAGGWTSEAPPPPEIVLEELRFGARVVWEAPEVDQSQADLGATDIQRMIAAISLASREAQIPRPRQPWLPALAGVHDLARVPTLRQDTQLVFGVCDQPEEQDQPPIAFRPDEQGNLAVYGTGGSGKSTLLRTLAIAAGFTVRGGPCHVYGLDFGNRGLAMLEELPHVGSIISGADTDRTIRLIKWLTQLVADRGERYSRIGAGSITDYRTLAGAPHEARILLLVDGTDAFRQAYETVDRLKHFDAFCQLARDGRAVGLHVLLTADRPASVPSALASAVQTRVVLRMADPNDYSALDVPVDVLQPSSPVGRGLLLGEELQVALLGGAPQTQLQAAAVREFADAMIRAGISAAPPVRGMPDRVLARQLPSTDNGLPVVGLLAETLSPATVVPQGGFLISGPPQSGRTSAVRTIARALHRWKPDLGLHLLSPARRSDLADLPLWRTQACGLDEVRDQAKTLAQQLTATAPQAILIENVGEFAAYTMDTDTADAVTELVRVCLDQGGFVVGESDTSTLGSKSGPLELLKRSRYGLALSPDSGDGDRVFTTEFPMKLPRADFPPGRGLLVRAGRTAVVGVGFEEG
ncbi:cell division protein FtsK [Catellatospora methionotrophica]|uniref:Cell division protein FtsK n=1 Tax=Catellatospora methionotrophica TaxID=121620 RepID=A0A8J3PJ87_9ACTN|nr:FtsK/SpoIIIE domain-containing protein [Catellatospora methionotrophica]GIG17156.1 cell division protein FtsK [Catellatospora methionotrophica]